MSNDRWTGELHLTDVGGLFGRITDAFGMVTELHGTRQIGSAANDWRPGWIVTAHLVEVPATLGVLGDQELGIETADKAP